MVEKIKIYLWLLYRNLINIKSIMMLDKRSILCKLGFHSMIRGMGWSSHERFDACKRSGCNYSKWVEDELGCKLMDKNK